MVQYLKAIDGRILMTQMTMMMMMMSGYWSYGTDAEADDNDDENHDDETTCRWSQHVSAAVHRSAGLFIAQSY